ncbi:hypothetical protein HMPREF9444_01286 [Succinatimonas hippei YIT 12066]|uniref:Uncharacterized protein n=1 Tax=Succinatimonas hippei (strain DSM 22608 / JCM 16073 / KCTC 15190 / YIT 12066) TaxID=762983 RepID=E8LKP3_SUCHY|nr:hypothetical protein HMPREF9444_01286 [Succinatimonas hippei YIT 12066]
MIFYFIVIYLFYKKKYFINAQKRCKSIILFLKKIDFFAF